MEQYSINMRPRKFEDLLGQSQIKNFLKTRAKQNKWPKAMLMRGMYGTGKTTTAQLVAMSIQCKHKDSEGNPCCECASCKDIMEEKFDRNTIRIDGGGSGGKNSVMEATENLKIRSMYDSNWVFLVEEADQLSSAAINSFLKLLEHPKENIYFILLSMEAKGVPPAIASRCQIFNFRPFSVRDTMLSLKSLMEKQNLWQDDSIPVEFKTKGLAVISTASKGSLRSALQMLETALVGKIYKEEDLRRLFSTVDEIATFNIIRGLLNRSKSEELWNTINDLDPSELINYITLILSNVMIYKEVGYIQNEVFLDSTRELSSYPLTEKLFLKLTTYPALQKPYTRKSDLLAALASFYIETRQEIGSVNPSVATRNIRTREVRRSVNGNN